MTSVQIDKTSLSNVRLLLNGVSKEAPKILTRALNNTATKGRTEASKAIRKEVKLSASYVNSRLKVDKANFRTLQARVRTPSRGILLSRFSTNAQARNPDIGWIRPPDNPPRGIKVRVSPNDGSKIVTGGDEVSGKPFYIVLKNRNLAIAARLSSPGPNGGKIKVFSGPSLSQVFNNIKEDLGEPLAQYQEEQVSKQIDAVLRGF